MDAMLRTSYIRLTGIFQKTIVFDYNKINGLQVNK